LLFRFGKSSETLYMKLFPGFRQHSMTEKLFRKQPLIKIRVSPESRVYTGKIKKMKEKERRTINSDTAFGTIFRISKYFQRSKQKLYT
jgi:hypothetical protein